MAKHFLYLTNEQLNCFVWQGGRIVARQSFAAINPGSQEFERYLFKYRREPVFLIVDLTEEDFRSETIPHLRGGDQAAVLNRRMNQVYRNSPFRHALVQGREPDGRRDDRVLYHGITNADLIKPWLAVMDKLGIAVEGIYSAPVLSSLLLKTLDIFFPHTLLVSLVSGNGLRQTYFNNKLIKFSRLTPLDHGSDVSFGAQVAEEASRTWQYLDSLRFFSGEDTLEVCILTHPSDRQAVSEAIKDYPLLQHRLLGMDDVANKLGMKELPAGSQAEELFVYLFAKSRLENHFAQQGQTRVARLRKLGTALHMVNGVVLASALISAGVMLGQAQKLDGENDRRNDRALQLSRQHQDLMREVQTAQVSSETSREAASFYNEFLSPAPAPGALLEEVSSVLARFPGIRINQVAWQASEDEKSTPIVPPYGATTTLPLRSEVRADGAPAPPATAPGAAQRSYLAGSRNQVLVIDASVAPFTGDYRSMLEEIDRLVQAFNKLPGCTASVLKSPLDTTASANIRANLSRKGETANEAQFSVRILKVSGTKAGAT